MSAVVVFFLVWRREESEAFPARSGERLLEIPDNFSKNPMIDPPNENKKTRLATENS